MTPPRPQSDRAFGVMFAIVFATIAAVAFFVFDKALVWALVTAAVFLGAALVVPWVLMPLNRLWTALAARLGVVNNYVLLGVFFYLCIAPAGRLMRLFSDPMRRRIDPHATTYWTPVGRKATADTYRDLF